jgi:hypothetical protein
MFFLLKSGFWLAIVYSCMVWPDQERPETIARAAAQHVAAQAQAKAVETVSAHCAGNPASCIDLARRATSPTRSASADGKAPPRKSGN